MECFALSQFFCFFLGGLLVFASRGSHYTLTIRDAYLLTVTLALLLTGLDFTTSLSGAATALANVGPGLGETIGPAGNFTTIPDAAKWILVAGMLVGRLEIMTVLVLFSGSFWCDV